LGLQLHEALADFVDVALGAEPGFVGEAFGGLGSGEGGFGFLDRALVLARQGRFARAGGAFVAVRIRVLPSPRGLVFLFLFRSSQF
jgi:hypothetical protein